MIAFFRFFSLLGVLLCANNLVVGQGKTLDSLQKRLPFATSDTAKINLMNKINFQLNRQNNTLALQKTKETVLLAQKAKYPLGELVALRSMAMAYSELEKTDSAHICLDKSFKMHELIQDKYQDASYYSALGNLYLNEGLSQKALKAFQTCLNLLEETKDSVRMPGMLNNIGIIHKTNGNTSKSREYLFRTLEMSKRVKNYRLVTSANVNLGISYLDTKEYQIALTYFKRADSLAMKFEGRPNKFALYNLGQANFFLKNYEEAKRYFNQCLALAEEEKDLVRQVLAKKALSNLANELKQWNLGIKFGNEALEIVQKTKDLENYQKVYEVLFNAYKGAKQFEKAIMYQSLLMAVKDSISSVEKAKQINELETQYEVEKKDAENEKLREMELSKDSRIKQQMWIIVSSLIIIGLVAFLSIMLYRSRQKEKGINVVLENKKVELQSKNDLLEEVNGIKDRLFSIISHDLRAPLGSLKNLLTLLNDKTLSEAEVTTLFPKLTQEVGYTSDLLDSLLHWAKSQLHGIHTNPKKIDMKTLVEEKISIFSIIAEQKNIELRNEIGENVITWADKDMTRAILRNLVSNALKFTGANGHIRVSAQTLTEGLEICVEDTGVGISQEVLSQLFKGNITTRGTKNEKGTGLGLMLVKDFVEKNNGTIRVESEVGKGSKFIFTLPLAEILEKTLA